MKMDALMKFAVDNYLLDVAIGLMGLFAFALIVERFKALYFEYSLKAEPFMQKIAKLVDEDKIEEAITFCAANEKKPLAQVVKRILERSDRDDEAIQHSLEIAASEVGPRITKNLSYLAMASNVVTLIGLLGTVVGLIMSFKAVSFADPAQKQSLLADGISLAMHATAAGLMVAIPTMVLYSFLHARQGRIFAEIDEHANKLIEQLRSRELSFAGAYAGLANDKKNVKIPPPNIKAA
jgi:biopolymer transport protein ExbB/TolQ